MFAALLALSFSLAQASSPIPALVDAYYAQNFLRQTQGDCPVDQTACFNRLCSFVGSPGCTTLSEAQEALKACRGNYNDRCLYAACSHLGSFGCDTMGEVTQVAQACRGNLDASCLESVCAKLGAFGCDQLSEVTAVAQSCGGG